MIKKHHSIAYDRNLEVVAAGTCQIAKEDFKKNISDLFTQDLIEYCEGRTIGPIHVLNEIKGRGV